MGYLWDAKGVVMQAGDLLCSGLICDRQGAPNGMIAVPCARDSIALLGLGSLLQFQLKRKAVHCQETDCEPDDWSQACSFISCGSCRQLQ